MSVYDKGLLTILGVSLLLVLVALPLALRKIRRNVVYGFRTRASMSSEALWYAANAHFGRGLILASLCGAAAATVSYLLRPFPPELFLPLSILILALPSLVAALATQRYLRRLQDGD